MDRGWSESRELPRGAGHSCRLLTVRVLAALSEPLCSRCVVCALAAADQYINLPYMFWLSYSVLIATQNTHMCRRLKLIHLSPASRHTLHIPLDVFHSVSTFHLYVHAYIADKNPSYWPCWPYFHLLLTVFFQTSFLLLRFNLACPTCLTSPPHTPRPLGVTPTSHW